jgi:GT2 family glycosyltransferase
MPARRLRAVRLVIQIPCYNEESSIRDVIGEIPRQIPDADEVVVLVVDNGSTNRVTGRRRCARNAVDE